MSHFFAYLARMKHIQRWGLMRNTTAENIQEHSLQVAMLAHGLALIRNKLFGGTVNPERVALLAVYHDASEVITGDLATPIKTFNPEIRTAYRQIEEVARNRLLQMLPDAFTADYATIFHPAAEDAEHWKIVKAADKISAYLKCVEELKSGNQGYLMAERKIKSSIAHLHMPEVEYFMLHYAPSFSLTLDELN